MRADLPDKVEITTKRRLLNGGASPTAVTRTSGNFGYNGRALALIDFDGKGMPGSIAAKVKSEGGIWNVLKKVCPPLTNIARVIRRSTSSGLYRTDTGERLPGSDGEHIFLVVKDGADNKRFLELLHDLCWLAGFGRYIVSAGRQLLEQSIIDRMVWGAERLVFEGAPVLEPPLAQDTESRQPIAIDGDVLDTQVACPPLALDAQSQLNALRDKERVQLAAEVAAAREKFIERQAKKLVARTKCSVEVARRVIIRQCEGVLLSDVELPFDDPELARCTVGDVLADPDRFVGETLADPIEGIEYGINKAMIMRRADGSVFIHSFAHGHTFYELKRDADDVRKILDTVAKENVVATLIQLVVEGDINAAEEDLLRKQASKRSGVGLQSIKADLKAARQKQAQQEAERKRAERTAQRQDPRPEIRAPLKDDPWEPQMDVINNVLGNVIANMPPVRDLEDCIVQVRKLIVPRMHAFSSKLSNASDSDEKLPPPEQYVISRRDEMSTGELIGKYIDYFDVDKDGNRRSVHLSEKFVRPYLQRHDDMALPRVAAIATTPIVLADGVLLAPDGLDRERGIQFIIPDELRSVIPRREDCTDEAVKEAMKFLCNEWLCDVATDFVGKAITLSLASSLIERSLLDQRPVLLHYCRQTGDWQDHTDLHADHGCLGGEDGCRFVVNERGRTPEGHYQLFSLRVGLHPVGQHSAGYAG